MLLNDEQSSTNTRRNENFPLSRSRAKKKEEHIFQFSNHQLLSKSSPRSSIKINDSSFSRRDREKNIPRVLTYRLKTFFQSSSSSYNPVPSFFLSKLNVEKVGANYGYYDFSTISDFPSTLSLSHHRPPFPFSPYPLSSSTTLNYSTPLLVRVDVFKSGVSIARTSTKQVEQKPRETPCFT